MKGVEEMKNKDDSITFEKIFEFLKSKEVIVNTKGCSFKYHFMDYKIVESPEREDTIRILAYSWHEDPINFTTMTDFIEWFNQK